MKNGPSAILAGGLFYCENVKKLKTLAEFIILLLLLGYYGGNSPNAYN